MGGEGGIEDWQQQRDGAEEGDGREDVGFGACFGREFNFFAK